MSTVDPRRFVEPSAYKELGYPYREWARLRRQAPVAHFTVDGWPSFWAVTRHSDVVALSCQPTLFVNAPGIALERTTRESAHQMRSIINMDPPEHGAYRRVAAPWFTTAALARLESVVTGTARRLIDALGDEGECDFVESVATRYPLHVVATLLGVPECDEPFLMEVTREIFEREDIAQAEADHAGRNRETFFEFYSYFSRLIEDRRAQPRDDLATAFATASIDGCPMGRMETLSYGLVTVTAGHETTRGSVAGGLLALIERPEALRRWATDPALTATAADEILRFVSPVVYMMRTATQDHLLRDRTIRAGDRVLLFHASANRDEEVFANPDELDLARTPNPHVALGVGEHACLGGRLARRMTGAVLEEFVRRVDRVELAGRPQRVAANMIPSLASLPIRYRMRPRAASRPVAQSSGDRW